MKTIADTLEVSRSRQYAKRETKAVSSRSPYYKRKDDDAFLLLIRQITDDRPTYGYRRVTALINRQRMAQGQSRINPKRIYRLLKMHGLLLPRYSGKPTRTHDGRIIMNRSNLRWCSDGFEIACWNEERIRLAFSMDCCDREVMSYVATTGGISGDMIRDLMAESIEARFGKTDRLPHRIQWLSDNGPAYIARETRSFAHMVGLDVWTTPFYSPESNGMAECFVKTFKRDYVHINNLTDAVTVLNQLPGWFTDYNENHPHQGLKMMSPREYRKHQNKLELCPVK
ncbi:IS3 family transposase [bacterium]|nr:IS3 family transposase [bacterium]